MKPKTRLASRESTGDGSGSISRGITEEEMPAVIPLIRKILAYWKTGSVIDIGAGQGHHALFFAEQGFAITAIDSDTALVERLAKTAGCGIIKFG